MIARDPATGFVSGSTLGVVTDERKYNDYGEERSYRVMAEGAVLYDVKYDTAANPRDGLGRIVTKTETIEGATTTSTYSYDGLCKRQPRSASP